MVDASLRREKLELTRRNFLSLIGWSVLQVSGVAFGLMGLRYFWANTSAAPPTKFTIGRAADAANFSETVPYVDVAQRTAVWRRGNTLIAIWLKCQHLGCTVKIVPTGYNCPCHGSKYDQNGNVYAGPAPRGLRWLGIAVTPAGDLQVDKNKQYPPLTPAAYYHIT